MHDGRDKSKVEGRIRRYTITKEGEKIKSPEIERLTGHYVSRVVGELQREHRWMRYPSEPYCLTSNRKKTLTTFCEHGIPPLGLYVSRHKRERGVESNVYIYIYISLPTDYSIKAHVFVRKCNKAIQVGLLCHV